MSLEQNNGRIIIITGLSGSGKSTALNALEDNGFFCIDNLPVMLLPKFLALRDESDSEIMKLGVVMDMREKEFVSSFQTAFSQIKSLNYDLHVVFLEASDATLVKRFSETRRPHPLAGEGSLLDGIRRERELMANVREAAQEVVDTTLYNTHKLREVFFQKYAQAGVGQHMSVEIISFGFKHGLPSEADILMDVRFLPNPFYLDDLRDLDGRDNRVVEYVMVGDEGSSFLDKLYSLLEYVIPLYKREGKSYLAIAIGCTGGQHRSVTIVEKMAERLKELTGNLTVRHRDIIQRREEK